MSQKPPVGKSAAACNATKADGTRCGNSARTGSKYCGTHKGYRPKAAAKPAKNAAKKTGGARTPKKVNKTKSSAPPAKTLVAQKRSKSKPSQTTEAPSKAGKESHQLEGKEKAAIHEQARLRSIDPSKVTLPQFPPANVERPKPLQEEEKRRKSIDNQVAELRHERRQQLTEDRTELDLVEAEWAMEDSLIYRPEPADVEVEVYTIMEGYAYVQIIRNESRNEMLYHVIEPRLSPDEQTFLSFIEKTLVDVLDLQPSELDRKDLQDYIREKFDEVMADYSLILADDEKDALESKNRLLYYVLRDFMGEGPIDVFMNDPLIEDISCDGPHVPVFLYHRKYEALTSTVRFRDDDELDSFVIRMAQRAGKHINIADPILDATMTDGSRLQATLAHEVSSHGSSFTIRKFKETPFTPIDLVRFGTMDSKMLAYIWMVMEGHMSAIFAGGTASGKTTAINALMMFIPPQNKVVTIEDTRELQVPEPNWIAGITRGGFGPRDDHGRQAGEIDMFQLLKNALRQRPEYIIVGEVRGAEAYSLFQAMATGHAAYGTMHADSVNAVIHRLNSDPINIPRSLLEALDLVAVQAQTRVGGKRVRRTKQMTEIVGLDPNTQEILTNEVFHWEPSTDRFHYSGSSYNLERIAAETARTIQQVEQDMDGRAKLIDHVVKLDLHDYSDISQIIRSYFRDADKVKNWMKGGKPWQ